MMASSIRHLWDSLTGVQESTRWDVEEFGRRFDENFRACDWEPHPLYSVFTQYDQEYYLRQREAFLHKYRCFYSVSKTIGPRRMIELGTCAGSSADAYLSAAPGARYIGLDVFGENTRHDNGAPWKPLEIAERLFKDRGYRDYQLRRVDLRTIDALPGRADFVVVDAAHDFANEYADLKLALTADPVFIFVDDADDDLQAKPAIEKFLNEDLQGRVEFTLPIEYMGGGLVIKLRK